MILVDANPLIALVDPRDELNRQATEDLQRLIGRGLLLPTLVLSEVCFAIPLASQRARLRALLEETGAQPLSMADEKGMWSDVFDWLQRYADHRPDWTDAYLAVLCGRDRGLKVWTYDQEFRTIWRRPDGSPIPLAGSPRR